MKLCKHLEGEKLGGSDITKFTQPCLLYTKVIRGIGLSLLIWKGSMYSQEIKWKTTTSYEIRFAVGCKLNDALYGFWNIHSFHIYIDIHVYLYRSQNGY